MAMFQRTEIQVKADPIKNGNVVNSEEETVQALWNSVRTTFKTDMRALTFSQMSQQDKYKWSSALLTYINQNDDIKVVSNDNMRTPNGNIKISREVVLAANTKKALNLGGVVLMTNQVQEHKMLHISQNSYQRLGKYVQEVRPAMLQRPNTAAAGNAFAMALMFGALMAAADSDDE